MDHNTDTYVNPLRQMWLDGTPTVGTWLRSNDPMVAESLTACGFHFVIIDMQHFHVGWSDLPSILMAIRLWNGVPIVRVPSHDSFDIGRALDLGALGILVPVVNTAEQAASVIAAARFPTAGIRSFGYSPARARATFGRTDIAATSDVVCILQIETAAAVDDLPRILTVPGVDAILPGPGDIALTLGIPIHYADRSEAETQQMTDIEERIRTVCAEAGVVSGFPVADAASAARKVAAGYPLVTFGSDLEFVADGADALKRVLGEAPVVRDRPAQW